MSETREKMLTFNTEKIEHAYAQAISDGLADPVILVLDVSDDLGRSIAEARAGKAEIDRQLQNAADGMTPILMFSLSIDQAWVSVANISEQSGRFLAAPTPNGRFRVGIIADSGVLWAFKQSPKT